MNKILKTCELITEKYLKGKKDITGHSDDELSLIVFNDEYFYDLRKRKSGLIEILNECFIFSDEQLKVLLNDIKEDLES